MHKSIISYRNMIDSGLILMPEVICARNTPTTLKRLYEPHRASQGHYTIITHERTILLTKLRRKNNDKAH